MSILKIVRNNKLCEEFNTQGHFSVQIRLQEEQGQLFDKIYRLGPAVRILRNIIKRYEDKFEDVRNVYVYYMKVSFEYENEYTYKEVHEEKEYRLSQELTTEQANEQIRLHFLAMKIYFHNEKVTIADMQNLYYFLDAINHKLGGGKFIPVAGSNLLFLHWGSYKEGDRLGTNLLRDMYKNIVDKLAVEKEFQEMLDEERLTERMSDHAYRVFDALGWDFEKHNIQFRENFDKDKRISYIELRVRPGTTVKESDILLAMKIYKKYVYPTIKTQIKVTEDGTIEKDSDK